MKWTLEIICGNKATHTEWCKAAHDYTTRRKKGPDGVVTVIRKGWSDATFNRKLDLAKEKWGSRLIQTGTGQGATYSLMEGVQPAEAGGEAETQEPLSPKALISSPYGG
jgi:hypothetical protein